MPSDLIRGRVPLRVKKTRQASAAKKQDPEVLFDRHPVAHDFKRLANSVAAGIEAVVMMVVMMTTIARHDHHRPISAIRVVMVVVMMMVVRWDELNVFVQ